MTFDKFNNSDATFEEVKTLLESDLSDFGNEVGKLYNEIERYAEVADALDTANREEDAEYFRELAADRYASFIDVIQIKKFDDDDYDQDYE